MSGKFLVQQDWFLANGRVERDSPLNRFGRCLRSAHDFNQRDDMGWIERMPNEDALGVLALRLHDAWRYSR